MSGSNQHRGETIWVLRFNAGRSIRCLNNHCHHWDQIATIIRITWHHYDPTQLCETYDCTWWTKQSCTPKLIWTSARGRITYANFSFPPTRLIYLVSTLVYFIIPSGTTWYSPAEQWFWLWCLYMYVYDLSRRGSTVQLHRGRYALLSATYCFRSSFQTCCLKMFAVFWTGLCGQILYLFYSAVFYSHRRKWHSANLLEG